ncbi:carbohydrate kinase [Silicimonas algicola]|uniref:Sugar (Pentulose or hexulose) kinase n=1 Tax=Silicimonas algicola TaxID=1826607 RepID=A0A316GBH0_9RHOB|nr:FGGY-family carbohydrate kinase [Silicimonas algicola]AZQ65960.1 carbohydrate kinase [Silicimonas algicola]PWK58248.1 sugar (pentulose or hexulose) kinase [Silicimonas algicola]
MRHVAVIDIGKTNAKVALVDLDTMSEVAVVTRPNTVRTGPPWPHFDLDGHWSFILEALRAFHDAHGIEAISVTTHGASIVLVDREGRLATPMLDYEHQGPDEVAAEYDAIRPPFEQTGSPRLSAGLNVGAQLHWMLKTDPGLRDRTALVLTYPQYWSFRLTGVAATEVTSLGCHTDLWNPSEGKESALLATLGLENKLAPQRPARDVLGTILPDVAARTGLPATTPVHCGIHDSNASLLPYVLGKTPPFSVVSTGTWVIEMSMGGEALALDPARDTLVNVNALGAPVPSARFMGGREHDIVSRGSPAPATLAALSDVIIEGVMLMPSVVPETGPFQGRAAYWVGREPSIGTSERAAALGAYLALMTAEGLTLTGHRGDVVVEGPFARNEAYLAMLSAVTGSLVLPSRGSTGTSQGCALLALPDGGVTLPETTPVDRRGDADLIAYADAWRRLARA